MDPLRRHGCPLVRSCACSQTARLGICPGGAVSGVSWMVKCWESCQMPSPRLGVEIQPHQDTDRCPSLFPFARASHFGAALFSTRPVLAFSRERCLAVIPSLQNLKCHLTSRGILQLRLINGRTPPPKRSTWTPCRNGRSSPARLEETPNPQPSPKRMGFRFFDLTLLDPPLGILQEKDIAPPGKRTR